MAYFVQKRNIRNENITMYESSAAITEYYFIHENFKTLRPLSEGKMQYAEY